MKRVAMDSHQSLSVDEHARARFKHQSLMQDYLELQKDFVSKKKKLQMSEQKKETLNDFVSKKKKLQMSEQKKETLFAEVRFLRQRLNYLLEMQSSKQKLEEDYIQQENTAIKSKMHIEDLYRKADDAPLKNLSTPLESNPTAGGAEEERGKKERRVREPLGVKKKPKNCLINEKKVGKKKISWQDPVALKV